MKDFIKAIEALVIDSANLAGAFLPFSATGLTEACQIIRIVNASNVSITVSYDNGTTDSEFLFAGSSIQLYFQTNSRPNNKAALLAKGTRIGVTGAKGVGNIYCIGYYQEQ